MACRKNVYKVNGLLGRKEDEEERKKIRTKRKAFPQLCGKTNKKKGFLASMRKSQTGITANYKRFVKE